MLKTGIAAGIPLKFYAFDILERDGQDLTGLPLIERKDILEDLIGEREAGDSLQYSHHVLDNGKAVFDAMCAGGHEGVIAKRADGRYIGDRTTTWLKIKCTKRSIAYPLPAAPMVVPWRRFPECFRAFHSALLPGHILWRPANRQ